MGESYYNPQTDYIGTRALSRSSATPPEAQTYAERFATSPIYGSAYGLPYDSSKSVFVQPMASLRASSRTPSRASSLSRDPEAHRAASGALRNRRSSMFDDDDDFPRNKPFKKYSMDKADFEPIKSSDLRDRIRKISDDFNKTPSYEPRRDYQKTETTWKTISNTRGQPVIQRQDVSYTSPETGKTYRRSSITDDSNYDYKRPIDSVRTRRSSIGTGEEFSKTTSSVRTRKFSESGSSGLPPRPARYSSIEEPKFSSAQSIRDARKMQESDDLTENIQKMVNKMRSHHLDNADADIRSISRTVRSTSVDPFEDDSPRSRSRQRARLNQFTYGIGRR